MKKYAILLMTIVVFGILLAGCTEFSPKTGPVTTAAPLSPLSPTPEVTTITTTAPQPVVTVIHYISQTKEIRDPDLLFALQVPVEWNVSTYQLMRTDTPDYWTDLSAGTLFSISSNFYSQNKDKEYRDQFRQWSPAPDLTTVTMNGITYDRFESAADGWTNVSYIVRGSSANERGYTSVLVFTARDSNRFEKEDFEKVVSSFRYFGRKSAIMEPGEEIPMYDIAGNPIARKTSPQLSSSSLWEEAGSYSSDGDSSGGDASDGGSSDGGGGGCGCG